MINAVLAGGIAVAALAAGLFFLRFWRSTRDRFFIFFAASFALEGLARAAGAFVQLDDNNPMFYGIRVIAYGLIIIAIWQKNRR